MNSSHVYLIDNDARRREHLAGVFDDRRYTLQSFADVATFIERIDYACIPDAACVVTHLDLAPLNGVDLLKILPELGQAQDGLGDLRGNHVERDQRADREFAVDHGLGPKQQQAGGGQL